MSDFTRVAEDREIGFAVAARMIGKLLTAWEEGQAEIARQRPVIEAAQRICGDKPNVADFDALHAAVARLVPAPTPEGGDAVSTNPRPEDIRLAREWMRERGVRTADDVPNEIVSSLAALLARVRAAALDEAARVCQERSNHACFTGPVGKCTHGDDAESEACRCAAAIRALRAAPTPEGLAPPARRP